MDMNVKGSVFVEIVKAIRRDKSGVYDKYLRENDREIVRQRILPSSWYPYETYKRCLKAIFEVVAKNDFEVAKEWGRMVCKTLSTTIYAKLVEGRDPLSFFEKYAFMLGNLFDFGKLETLLEGTNRVVYKLSGFDAQFVPLYYIIQGWMECGLELCGAKNVKSEFVTKSWEGQPVTSIRFTWT